MIKTLKICLIGLISCSYAFAEELKDPYSRDEDISAAEVSVVITQQADGLYVYRYIVNSPVSNKGEILSLSVNISCSFDFEPADLPYPVDREGFSDPHGLAKSLGLGGHVTGGHTPSAVSADYGSSPSYGVTIDHLADWLIALPPNGERTGLQIVSQAKPGLREYVLTPWMDNDESWDYPEAPPPDRHLPWIPDFTVTGMIAGPGCPGEVPPVGTEYFPGTERESAAVNKLLTYSAPLKDRWHVDASVTQVKIVIHYSVDIDPETFKVEPGWARHLFNPVPGEEDTVMLDLKQSINKFKFEVSADKTKTKRKEDELHHSFTDRDFFEIRRDDPKKTK